MIQPENNNSSPCESCNSIDSIQVYETSFLNVPVIQCNSCGHAYNLFVSDAKARNSLNKYYKGEYWKSFRNKGSTTWKKQLLTMLNLLPALRFRYQRAYSQLVYINKSPASVLEIGAGKGDASLHFAKRGWKVTAVEPDKNNAIFIQDKNPEVAVINSTMEELNISLYFDLVFSSHVIEHSFDVKLFLIKTVGLMMKGGVLFLEVPNAEKIDVLNDSVNNEPHTNHFTQASLENFVKKAGLEVLRNDIFYYGVHAGVVEQFWRTLMFVIFGKDIYKKSSRENGDVIRLLCTKK